MKKTFYFIIILSLFCAKLAIGTNLSTIAVTNNTNSYISIKKDFTKGCVTGETPYLTLNPKETKNLTIDWVSKEACQSSGIEFSEAAWKIKIYDENVGNYFSYDYRGTTTINESICTNQGYPQVCLPNTNPIIPYDYLDIYLYQYQGYHNIELYGDKLIIN